MNKKKAIFNSAIVLYFVVCFEILNPAFAGDTLTMLTWVANFHKVRSLRRYKLIRAKDQTVVARAETDWVFVNARTGRPLTIPDEIKNTLPLVGPPVAPAGNDDFGSLFLDEDEPESGGEISRYAPSIRASGDAADRGGQSILYLPPSARFCDARIRLRPGDYG